LEIANDSSSQASSAHGTTSISVTRPPYEQHTRATEWFCSHVPSDGERGRVAGGVEPFEGAVEFDASI